MPAAGKRLITSPRTVLPPALRSSPLVPGKFVGVPLPSSSMSSTALLPPWSGVLVLAMAPGCE